VLLDTLEEVLPSDIHERCSNGNVHVAITKVWPKPAAKLVSQFGTRKELIETLLVSCHIPWWATVSEWLWVDVYTGIWHFSDMICPPFVLQMQVL
jgi:hypothetical protein